MYLAHISKDNRRQYLMTHSLNVKVICEQKGKKINLPHLAGLIGLLHDVGKYSAAFQNYLLNGGKRGSIRHAFVGAQILALAMKENWGQVVNVKQLLLFSEAVSNAILAHHSSLKDMRRPDGMSPYLNGYATRVDYVDIEQIYERFLTDIQVEFSLESIAAAKKWLFDYMKLALTEFLSHFVKRSGESIHAYMPFLCKTLYSILVDADRTDTALFMDGEGYKSSNYHPQLQVFAEQLEQSLQDLQKEMSSKPLTDQEVAINALRQKMSDVCKEQGKLPTGVYELPIPTGGGKTFSAIRFALDHAIAHGKDRIIYVVPYTSIVEQNSNVIRKALNNSKLVFEHHSNIRHPLFEDTEDQLNYYTLRKNGEQTWDLPIIFTTSVQLLNTIFKNKAKYNRRLHNLTNAVIIFDEVQSLPPHTIHLFNEAVNYLTYVANTTVVLCSATQPTLDNRIHPIKRPRSLITLEPSELSLFERVKVENCVQTSGWNTEQLGTHILQNINPGESALIILNTKDTVKALYNYLKNINPVHRVYYLTTNLCAEHRQQILEQIQQDLADKNQIICISTSLIEAGVDISFSIVYRALNGLDSIAQAAGRCNRHDELLNKGRVYIFKHNEEKYSYDTYLVNRKSATEKVLAQFEITDIFNKQAMSFYFNQTFSALSDPVKTPYGQKSLYDMLFPSTDRYALEAGSHELAHFAMYEIFSEAFEVINTKTKTVLAPYKVTHEQLLKMDDNEQQRYVINIYDNDFKKLQAADAIVVYKIYDEEIHFLKEAFYDERYGLKL